MDQLYELLNSFSPNEEKLLKKHLSHKSTSESRKDLQLLELMLTRDKMPNEQIIQEIYGEGKEKDKAVAHAYHQLRLRLNEKIEDFILQQAHKKEDKELLIFKYLLVARLLLGKKRDESGWHYLKKAEDLAIEVKRYELQIRIYTLQIDYASTQPLLMVEHLIKKRDDSLNMVTKDGKLSAALALINEKISTAKAFNKNIDVHQIAKEVLEKFNIENLTVQEPLFKYSLAMIICLSLNEKKEYQALVTYLTEVYEEMLHLRMFNMDNHILKVKLLGYICLNAFKSRNFNLCEKYINTLNNELLRYTKYKFPDYNLGILVSADMYIYTGRYIIAQRLLEELLKNKGKSLSITESKDFLNNLAHISFIEEKYSKAIQYLIQLENTEKSILKHIGIDGIFKIFMTEYIIRFEIGDYDYVYHKLRAVEKRFTKFLADPAHLREKIFMKLFKKLNRNIDLLRDKDFIEEVNNFIYMKPIEPGDTEFISFNAWLKAKVEGRKYYDVFLEMVS